MAPKCVAVIPAREGSKRIPLKNIKPFLGKPIITYPIEAALKTGLFQEVIVSTDSEKIAKVARDAGASVPFLRPPELADDFTPTADVLLHAMEQLRKANRLPDYLCCLYPTSAFASAEDLRNAFRVLEENAADAVISVTTFGHPVFRALSIGTNGALQMIWPENQLKRSNDLPEAFHDAAQFYWLNVREFLKSKNIWMAKAFPYVLPRARAQDVDTLEDWEMAEQKFRILFP